MNLRGNCTIGRVSVEVTVANYQDVLDAQRGRLAPDKVRQTQVQGVVDTGAARLVLPQKVVDELGFPPIGAVIVRYADQRTTTRSRVKDVWLKWEGREGTFTAIVEPDRTDALIGAIVLEELDLLVDCTRQQVHPRDPKGIISEIESADV